MKKWAERWNTSAFLFWKVKITRLYFLDSAMKTIQPCILQELSAIFKRQAGPI